MYVKSSIAQCSLVVEEVRCKARSEPVKPPNGPGSTILLHPTRKLTFERKVREDENEHTRLCA